MQLEKHTDVQKYFFLPYVDKGSLREFPLPKFWSERQRKYYKH